MNMENIQQDIPDYLTLRKLSQLISNTKMKSSSSPGWQIQYYDFLFLIIGQLWRIVPNIVRSYIEYFRMKLLQYD